MNRWQEHFEELLNTDNGNNGSFEDVITASVNPEENSEIGMDKVIESIAQIKKRNYSRKHTS